MLHNIFRGLLGILFIVVVSYLFSTNRKAISWRIVLFGLGFQIILALSIIYIPFIETVFSSLGYVFVKILDYSKVGGEFIFGGLMNSENYGVIFAMQILPTIVFFSALMSVLFYFGLVQYIVYALAWVLSKTFKVSGYESLAVAGNIFLGQTESPLLVKAYLDKMSNSEMFTLMTSGMATIAGGVMAAYIGMLGGADPAQQMLFAKHLITASVMAAPGAIVIAKIIVPQTENINRKIEVPKNKIGNNVLDAIAIGTGEGVKLAVNVGAMLVVFIAFIALINGLLGKLGDFTGLNEKIAFISHGNFDKFSLEFVLGYLFAPVSWIIGADTGDIALLGRLLGEKVVLTEFIGYKNLVSLKDAGAFASERSIIMATYMLCGFANFASIGIQIGGIGALAPGKKVFLTKYGLRAMVAGTMASLLSAAVIGMIFWS